MKKEILLLGCIHFILPAPHLFAQNTPSGYSTCTYDQKAGANIIRPEQSITSGDVKPGTDIKAAAKMYKYQNNSPQPATINLNARENDVYKSPVVARYVSAERLHNMELKNPGRIKLADFYFNKSFFFELIPGMQCEQKIIDAFIAQFDPYTVEKQRRQTEKTAIEYPDAGLRVILLPRNDIPVEIQKFILKFENKGGGGFHDGRPVPSNTGGMIKNK